MNLSRVRNPHALVRLVRPAPPRPPGAWGPLAAPVDPLETVDRARAQSLMSPTPKGGACPPLTLAQARDVLAWYRPAKP
jgi:hypothetical protein